MSGITNLFSLLLLLDFFLLCFLLCLCLCDTTAPVVDEIVSAAEAEEDRLIGAASVVVVEERRIEAPMTVANKAKLVCLMVYIVIVVECVG